MIFLSNKKHTGCLKIEVSYAIIYSLDYYGSICSLIIFTWCKIWKNSSAGATIDFCHPSRLFFCLLFVFSLFCPFLCNWKLIFHLENKDQNAVGEQRRFRPLYSEVYLKSDHSTFLTPGGCEKQYWCLLLQHADPSQCLLRGGRQNGYKHSAHTCSI